jgi:hypothetical protein
VLVWFHTCSWDLYLTKMAAGNDKDFRISLKDFETFVEKLSELVMELDPTVPELPKKDIVIGVLSQASHS